jgi:hypothetical protein
MYLFGAFIDEKHLVKNLRIGKEFLNVYEGDDFSPCKRRIKL